MAMTIDLGVEGKLSDFHFAGGLVDDALPFWQSCCVNRAALARDDDNVLHAEIDMVHQCEGGHCLPNALPIPGVNH